MPEMPMPMQGKPMQGQDQTDSQEGPGESMDVGSMLSESFVSMMKALSIMDKSGKVPQEKLQSFADLISAFKSWAKDLAGGAPGPQGPSRSPQQTTSPEQGANPNARPM